jgi:hypothetical protein
MTTKEKILAIINKKNNISIADLNCLNKSRTTLHKQLKQLCQEQKIIKKGKAPHVNYASVKSESLIIKQSLSLKNLSEMSVLEDIQNKFLLFQNLKQNLKQIFTYTFTEILNNAIDHSQGKKVNIIIKKTPFVLFFSIHDNGIGIFNKIKNELKLKNPVEAMQELIKGKTTTDKQNHTGEGIFFTSKAADQCFISSDKYKFSFKNTTPSWQQSTKIIRGTKFNFSISINSLKDLKSIFNTYTNEDYEFDTTSIYVKVFDLGTELHSRSQAKRLLTNLEKFKKIILDFNQLNYIGQSFADEIFRVWQNKNPQIKIKYQNTVKDVEFMILRALHR